MKNRETIKINQTWRSKKNNYQLLITGKSGGKFKTKVLTDKPGVFGGSHTMAPQSIWLNYVLIK